MNRTADKIKIPDKTVADGFGKLLQKIPFHERELLRPGRIADNYREAALIDGKGLCVTGDLVSNGVGPYTEDLLLLEFILPSS